MDGNGRDPRLGEVFGAPLRLTPMTLSLSLVSLTHLKGDLPRFFLSLESADASSPPSVPPSGVSLPAEESTTHLSHVFEDNC